MNAIQSAALGELCRILKAWKLRVNPEEVSCIATLSLAATVYLDQCIELIDGGDDKSGIEKMMKDTQEVVDFITNSPMFKKAPSLN